MQWSLFEGLQLLQRSPWQKFWLIHVEIPSRIWSECAQERQLHCPLQRWSFLLHLFHSQPIPLGQVPILTGHGAQMATCGFSPNELEVGCPDFLGQDIFSYIFFSLLCFSLAFLTRERCKNFHVKLLVVPWLQNLILPFLSKHSSLTLILEMML